MTNSVSCKRCGELKAAMDRLPPLPGDDATLVHENACTDCWQEWREEEVRTINELRLNFMDPEAQRILRDRMLAYLGLSADSEAGATDEPLEPLCDRD